MDRWLGESGFTLLELMVVVLIIGILVGIAIPVYGNVTATSRESTCLSNQRLIEGAAFAYLAGEPASLPAAAVLNGNHTATSWDVLVHNYLREAPKCPSANAFYYVVADGTVTGDGGHAGFENGHHHY